MIKKLSNLSLFAVFMLFLSCNTKEKTLNDVNTVLTKDSLEVYKKLYDEAAYFSIDKNENAQKQFAPKNIEDVMSKVVQDFSSTIKDGNTITLPVDKNGSVTKVNKMSVINHKWLIIDFYGEGVAGELLIEYNYTPDNVTTFKILDTVVY